MKTRIQNMRTPQGNPAKDQFIVHTEDGEYFQSYGTIIAYIPFNKKRDKITLDADYWNYSATTGKYRNMFLGEYISATRKKISSGEYLLDNLNN